MLMNRLFRSQSSNRTEIRRNNLITRCRKIEKNLSFLQELRGENEVLAD